MERLQEAIAKAKLGHELSARDLFIDIVRDDPKNKLAWLWLIGLLDDREDLIIACESVLNIDPSEKRVAFRLKKLRREKEKEKKEQEVLAFAKIDKLLARGNKETALSRLRKMTQENRNAEAAWILLAETTSDWAEKEQALARIYALDPQNKEKETAARRARYFRKNPLDLAVRFQEQGKIDEAIKVYEGLAAKAQGRSEWDRLLRKIYHLEGLQHEQIVHISSKITIFRLSLGVPLLFLFMLIIQIGYDYHHFTILMAVELLMVIVGAFLSAVSAVDSEHRIWLKLGNVAGRGSVRLRVLVGSTGITIMFLPFILLGLEAYARWNTVFEYIGYDF